MHVKRAMAAGEQVWTDSEVLADKSAEDTVLSVVERFRSFEGSARDRLSNEILDEWLVFLRVIRVSSLGAVERGHVESFLGSAVAPGAHIVSLEGTKRRECLRRLYAYAVARGIVDPDLPDHLFRAAPPPPPAQQRGARSGQSRPAQPGHTDPERVSHFERILEAHPLWRDAIDTLKFRVLNIDGKAQRTWELHKEGLQVMLPILDPQGSRAPDEVTANEVKRLVTSLREEHGNTNCTLNKRRNTLRQLYGCLGVQGDGVENPSAAWKHYKEEDTLPQYWDPPELRTVVNSLDRTTWEGKRNYALLQFLVDTALRTGEIAALRVGDCILDKPAGGCYVRVRAKTSKTRMGDQQPISDHVAAILREYIAERRLRGCTTDALWVSGRGTPIGKEAIRQAIRRASLKALPTGADAPLESDDLSANEPKPPHLTPRVLRQSAAMDKVLRHDWQPAQMAAFLRHYDPQMRSARRYLRLRKCDLARVHNRTSLASVLRP